MSSQTVKVNRFSSGRAEVKVSKPGCAGCNSVYTTHSEAELQELLALVGSEPVEAPPAKAELVVEPEPVVEPVTVEELDSFVEAEIEAEDAGDIGVPEGLTVVGVIDEAEEVLTLNATNETDAEVEIFRFMTNFRSGVTKVKAGESIEKEYKIPSDAEEVWLRYGSQSGEVLFHQQVNQDIS